MALHRGQWRTYEDLRPPERRFEYMDRMAEDEADQHAAARGGVQAELASGEARRSRAGRAGSFLGLFGGGRVGDAPPRGRVEEASGRAAVVVELNVDDARRAGHATLQRADVIRADPAADALRGALADGAGFQAAEAFLAVADNYREYCGRFANGYDWLGNSVVSGADQIGATDEDGAALIQESGVGV